MIRRPPRSTRTDTLFPYTTLFRARSEVEVGPVNGLCSIEIPLVGLGFGNLAPAAHLRQIPDRIRIKGIASIIPEEDVEIRRWPRVAGREGEGARHRIGDDRSEEHTFELKSLMCTSYAVFCLKKTHTRHR